MARKPRIHYHGALYHVICRGNNREEVFEDEYDKQNYLHTVMRYKRKYDFYLYCYCIMPNHAHLVIEVKNEPLSKIMQGIQQVYTMHFNKRHNRVGHIFQQRYKAILVDKQTYLMTLIKYVHYNPVKAGLEDGLNYRWSSHQYYLSKEPNALIDKSFPLSLFSGNRKSQIKNYLIFISFEDCLYEEKNEVELAPTKFRMEYKESSSNDVCLSPDILAKKVYEATGVPLAEIKNRSRKQQIVNARKLLVYMLDNFSNLNRKAISKYINLSQSSVSYILNDYTQLHQIEHMIELLNF